MAWLSDWATRISITIDSSKIDSNLTNFPLLIPLTPGTITDNIFDEVGENSKKIAITDDSGSQCYTEIESWDNASSTAYLWTKVPHIDSVEDTSIYLYYDSLQDGSTAYVGSHDKIDTSTGIRLEPDTSPYTATTLTTDVDLVDGDRGTAASNWWLADYSYGVDFGEAQTFDEIRVYGVDSGGSPLGTSYLGSDYDTVEVFVSDDNSSWSSVESFDAPTVTQRTDCSYMTLSLSTVQTSRYVKVVCTDSENIADSSGSTWYVTEVEAYAGITAAQNVWDSDFVGVWHMNQDPNGDVADSIKDSTVSGSHGTPEGSMATEDLVSAKIGGGIEFDGSDDDIYFSHDEPKGAKTISAIVQKDSGDYLEILATTGHNDYHGTEVKVNSGDMMIRFSIGTGSNAYELNYTHDFSDYTHIAHTWDGTTGANTAKLYVNGTLVTSDTSSSTQTADTWKVPHIAKHFGSWSNHWGSGIVDEVRASQVDRSDAWIKADYYSCFDDLITFGSIESNYYFSGYTQIDGTGTGPRTIYAFRRDNGTFMGSTTSSGNGYFYLSTTYSGSHLIVALDDDGGSDYNDLIFGRVYPATSF